MPICCEPGERYAVILEGDSGKTPSPTFWCRHLTVREFNRTLGMGDRMNAEPDRDRQAEIMSEALELSVVSWQNLPVEFEPGRLLDLLTVREAWELWEKILQANRLGGDDAKKSGSPSASDPAASAGAAGQGVAATAPAESNR